MGRGPMHAIGLLWVCACGLPTLVAAAVAAERPGLTLQPVEGVVAPSVLASRPMSVLVRLDGEPGWQAFARAGGRRAAALARQRADERGAQLRAQQAEFLRAAAALGARPLRQFQFIDNAVLLDVPRAQLPALARLPGVLRVGANRRYERTHTTSAALVRATSAWSGGAGSGSSWTGLGVTIAIIDDGIDYTHRHFGGAGDYAFNDRTVLGDVAWPPAALPAGMGFPMVIGGQDFVGDGYTAGLTPQPDPDPAGCEFSHGTHVAGSAAGYGVTAAGATFTGDLLLGDALFSGAPEPSLADFRIGPGMAPRATLVALRVFGCSGSTDTAILLQALEAAATGSWLGQDADVVNMSLGSSYGGSGPDDFLNGAQEALAELGIVVVASAGNSGDAQLVTGAPGTAATTISVANVTDSGYVVDGELAYTTPEGPSAIAAIRGHMYPGAAADPLTADIAVTPHPTVACSPLAEPAPTAWDGKWLVIDRGTCSFSQKVDAVRATGAAGAIVAQNIAGAPLDMGQTGGFNDVLPAIMISQADGAALRAAVAAYGSFAGTFDSSRLAAFVEVERQPSLTTSRGGVVRGSGDRILKPNLAAPGHTITSAAGGSNDLGYTISGTSMASPHVAGLVALLIEAHGRPADADGVALLKQRLMSTAVRDLSADGGISPPFHSPQRIGAGLVDVVGAISTPLVAYATDAPENVSLSFGYPRQQVGAPLQLVKTITLRNLGGTALQVATSYSPRSAWPGATVSVAPASITVPAGGSAAVQVTLDVHAEAPDLNVSGDPLYSMGGKTFLHEVSGYAVFTPDQGVAPIRTAVYAAPSLTADTRAPDALALDTVGASSIPLSGTGFELGPDGNDHASLVSAYTLLATDGVDGDLSWDVDGDGVVDPGEQLTDTAAADLHYLGAALQPEAPDYSWLRLGVAMHGEWNSPRDVVIEAWVDVNDDGSFDAVWFTGAPAADLHPVYLASAATPDQAFDVQVFLNDVSGAVLHTMLMRNNVLGLPMLIGWPDLPLIGIPSYAGGPVRVDVRTYQRDSDGAVLVDSLQATYTPDLVFDGSSNFWLASEGSAPTFNHDFSASVALPQLLTLHHHNHDPSTRAQLTRLVPLPVPFALLTPAEGAILPDASAIGTFTWEALPDAGSYSFALDAFAFTGTPEDDGDAVSCSATSCSLVVGTLPLPAGTHGWTVQATHPGGLQTASNAPRTLTVLQGLPAALFEDGFED